MEPEAAAPGSSAEGGGAGAGPPAAEAGAGADAAPAADPPTMLADDDPEQRERAAASIRELAVRLLEQYGANPDDSVTRAYSLPGCRMRKEISSFGEGPSTSLPYISPHNLRAARVYPLTPVLPPAQTSGT